MQGTINRLVEEKGFGFIRVKGGRDHFFHLSDLDADLDFGEHLRELRVEFDSTQEPRGARARNIRRAQ